MVNPVILRHSLVGLWSKLTYPICSFNASRVSCCFSCNQCFFNFFYFRYSFTLLVWSDGRWPASLRGPRPRPWWGRGPSPLSSSSTRTGEGLEPSFRLDDKLCRFLLQMISFEARRINITTFQDSQDEISELTSKFWNPPLVTLNCNNIPTVVVVQV